MTNPIHRTLAGIVHGMTRLGSWERMADGYRIKAKVGGCWLCLDTAQPIQPGAAALIGVPITLTIIAATKAVAFDFDPRTGLRAVVGRSKP
jgi:hypothetical protein